ncbi:MAG TPA: TetR family transcriptional regulator [Ilumatobacter sp.]|nr:TetR family transcriptional regulator [Ilumatobacter sp.]
MPQPAAQPMTANQRARRSRVIAAALKLASEGGYDAVQMRDVAVTADVALGTIYRYFPSKDMLLTSVMADWAGQLRERLGQNPPHGTTPATRVADVLQRACRSLEREPLLAAALVRALSSSEARDGGPISEVGLHIRAMIEPQLDDLDAEIREDIITVIGHVWLSTLIGWLNGRIQFSQVAQQLGMAAHLLLDDDYRRRADPT